MKVVIAAVMYSPNLGDGLIAECLTRSIGAASPNTEVEWLDIAGRTGFSMPSGQLRTRVLNLLTRLPPWLSQRVAEQLVKLQIRKHLDPLIPQALDGAEVIVLGGGQLFSDANLNFPLKIGHLVAAAEARNISISIHAVGVSATWSARGRELFRKCLASPNLCYISVRDDTSAQNLRAHYQDLGIVPPVAIDVFPDPGLLANELDFPQSNIADDTPQVAIGVTHPAALRTHAADRAVSDVGTAVKEYLALASALQRRGASVYFFTNGAGEDEEMLDIVAAALTPSARITRVPRAQTPKDLVGFIADMDAIASYRLHACIAAHANGCLAVGFRWDPKIDAYFELCDQSARLLSGPSETEMIADTLMMRLTEVELEHIDALKLSTRDSVRACIAGIRSSEMRKGRSADGQVS